MMEFDEDCDIEDIELDLNRSKKKGILKHNVASDWSDGDFNCLDRGDGNFLYNNFMNTEKEIHNEYLQGESHGSSEEVGSEENNDQLSENNHGNETMGLIKEFDNIICNSEYEKTHTDKDLFEMNGKLKFENLRCQSLEGELNKAMRARDELLEVMANSDIFDETCIERIGAVEDLCTILSDYITVFKNLLSSVKDEKAKHGTLQKGIKADLKDKTLEFAKMKQEDDKLLEVLTTKVKESCLIGKNINLEYTEHVENCSSELSDLRTEMQRRDDQIILVAQEKKVKTVAVLKYQAQINQLSSANEYTLSESTKIIHDKITLQNISASLKSSIKDVKTKFAQCQGCLTSLKIEVLTLKDLAKKRHEDCESVEHLCEISTAAIHKMERDVQCYEKRSLEVKKLLIEQNSVIENLESEKSILNDDLPMCLENLKKMQLTCAVEVNNLEEKCKIQREHSKSQNSLCEKEILVLQEKLGDLEKRFEEVENETASINAELMVLTNRVDLQGSEITLRKDKISELSIEDENNMKELEVNIQLVREQEENLEKLLQKMTLNNDKEKLDQKDQEMKITQLSTEMEDCSSVHAQSLDSIQGLKCKLINKAKLLDTLTMNQQNIKKSLDTSDVEKDAEIKKLTADVKELKTKISMGKESYREEIDNWNTKCKDQNGKMSEMDTISELAKSQLSELQEEYSNYDDELVAIKEQLNSLEVIDTPKLASKKEHLLYTIAEIKNNILQQEIECNEYKTENARLVGEINVLEKNFNVEIIEDNELSLKLLQEQKVLEVVNKEYECMLNDNKCLNKRLETLNTNVNTDRQHLSKNNFNLKLQEDKLHPELDALIKNTTKLKEDFDLSEKAYQESVKDFEEKLSKYDFDNASFCSTETETGHEESLLVARKDEITAGNKKRYQELQLQKVELKNTLQLHDQKLKEIYNLREKENAQMLISAERENMEQIQELENSLRVAKEASELVSNGKVSNNSLKENGQRRNGTSVKGKKELINVEEDSSMYIDDILGTPIMNRNKTTSILSPAPTNFQEEADSEKRNHSDSILRRNRNPTLLKRKVQFFIENNRDEDSSSNELSPSQLKIMASQGRTYSKNTPKSTKKKSKEDVESSFDILS